MGDPERYDRRDTEGELSATACLNPMLLIPIRPTRITHDSDSGGTRGRG